MGKLQGLLLVPNAEPIEMGLRVTKNNASEVIRKILGCESEPNASNCDFGVLYSSGDNDEARNALATQMRKLSRKMPQELSITNGRCFLVGEGEKESIVSVHKDAVTKVLKLYEELTGHSVSIRKVKSKVGPNKPKLAMHYFAHDFHVGRKAQLLEQKLPVKFADVAAESRVAWANKTQEEKAPYLALEAADKVRFNKEREIYLQKNPPAPKNPRNAYNMYIQEFPEKESRGNWKTLTPEQKAPFTVKSTADKLRYELELEAFKAHCIETGKDWESLTRKKRKKTEDKEDDEEPPVKRAKVQKRKDDEAPRKSKSKSKSKAAPPAKDAKAPKADKKKKGKSKSQAPEPVEEEEEAEEEAMEVDEEASEPDSEASDE